MFKTSEVFWCASPKLLDDNFRGRDFHASYDKTISVYCCRLLVIKVCAALSTCIFIPCSRASGADSPLQARLNHISQPIPTSKILNFSRTLTRKFGVCDLATSSPCFTFRPCSTPSRPLTPSSCRTSAAKILQPTKTEPHLPTVYQGSHAGTLVALRAG